jgi:Rrf2 family protein
MRLTESYIEIGDLELIRLSKRADYGLIAIRHLGLLPGGSCRSAREIAEEYHIPPALMAKLLQRLARVGLVASLHGTKGGYQLARPASQIAVRDVIEAIEGPVALVECLDQRKGDCPQHCSCPVQRPLVAVQDRIAEVLGSTMVSDL